LSYNYISSIPLVQEIVVKAYLKDTKWSVEISSGDNSFSLHTAN